MPHTGKPSGACRNCKERHRKCDEARPACGNCIRGDRVCSGYSEGLDLVLRDQTHSAKTAVERRQKRSSRKNSPSSTPSSVPSPLPESEESHALCFFVSSYVLYPRDPRTDRGFMELLPLFFADMKIDTPLSISLNAVARSFFAAWERRARDFETPALQAAYGKALKATRIAISDPSVCLLDETLMAVCLLGLYDTAVHSWKGQVSPVRHFNGAAALIKQRNGSMTSDLTKRLTVAVRSATVFRAMHNETPIDTTSDIWHDSADLPQNPATIFDKMSVDVANVLAFEKSGDLMESIPDFVKMARTADNKLASWPDLVPPEWFPTRIPVKNIPRTVVEAGIYGDGCDIYSDVLVCCTWNDWRSARLKLLALIAKYEPDHDTISTIQQLADGICSTFPYLLGDRITPAPMFAANVTYPSLDDQPVPKAHYQTAAGFGGWYMLTPLRQAICVGSYLRGGQVAWIKAQSQRLARIYEVNGN